MSKAWSGGSTRAWRRVRTLVLARDLYRCKLALPGTWTTRQGEQRQCRGTANSVHHLDGKARGDNPDRMIAACMPCNLKVGEPTRTTNPQGRGMTRW